MGKAASFSAVAMRLFSKMKSRSASSELHLELVHHLHQAPMPDLVARGERMQVADHLVGLAHVVAHDVQKLAVRHAASVANRMIGMKIPSS